MQMNYYINERNNIIHKGYINNIKISKNTRILSLNPNEINLWDNVQVYIILQRI